MILDCWLGEEKGSVLSKNQLKRMFDMYESEGRIMTSEKMILQSALDLQTTTVQDVMTEFHRIFMLDINQIIDK